jgi:hypothetical protein
MFRQVILSKHTEKIKKFRTDPFDLRGLCRVKYCASEVHIGLVVLHHHVCSAAVVLSPAVGFSAFNVVDSL